VVRLAERFSGHSSGDLLKGAAAVNVGRSLTEPSSPAKMKATTKEL